MEKTKFNYSYNIQQPAPASSLEQLLDTAINQHQQGQFQQAEQRGSNFLRSST
jgi:hypothetical protein